MVLNGDSLNGDSAFSGIENQYQEGVIFFTSPTHTHACDKFFSHFSKLVSIFKLEWVLEGPACEIVHMLSKIAFDFDPLVKLCTCFPKLTCKKRATRGPGL